jgi:hypothetical protein
LAASGRPIEIDLLHWPPDLFALTDTVLERTEAYRFVVSPPEDRVFRPVRDPGWDETIAAAARDWSSWVAAPVGGPPRIVADLWAEVQTGAATPLEEVASGRAWTLCEALLSLHAISDQACAPDAISASPGASGAVTDAVSAAGASFRARVRELLARTGSMSRVDRNRLRVLPKYRTPGGGIAARSIDRYMFVTGPGVDVMVPQISPLRRRPEHGQLNLLLLPWPMHVSDADFRPMPGSVRRRELEPYGYFDFDPSERFDVSLADRVLARATKEAERIDAVVLPENSIVEEDVPAIEAVLAKHGVSMLVAGVRSRGGTAGAFGSNWVLCAAMIDGRWSHLRQDKRHRWSLDGSQIEQYHLSEVLDPRVRWWEAIEVPRRALQLIERGDGHTIASVVCEDLAQLDDATALLRAAGPSLIIALLLDGPQLASRWAARYAGVLADDPGSAVLTLSSYGMVRRCWRNGQSPSSVVALWRDRIGGTREVTLPPGAEGILLTADWSPSMRRSADGRRPTCDVADLTLTDVRAIRAGRPTSPAGAVGAGSVQRHELSPADLTVLFSWVDALAHSGGSGTVLADAQSGAAWRAGLNLPQPKGRLSQALASLARSG